MRKPPLITDTTTAMQMAIIFPLKRIYLTSNL